MQSQNFTNFPNQQQPYQQGNMQQPQCPPQRNSFQGFQNEFPNNIGQQNTQNAFPQFNGNRLNSKQAKMGFQPAANNNPTAIFGFQKTGSSNNNRSTNCGAMQNRQQTFFQPQIQNNDEDYTKKLKESKENAIKRKELRIQSQQQALQNVNKY